MIYYSKKNKKRTDFFMTITDFYKNYLSINLKDYSNIGFDLEINKIILCLFIGIMLASVVLNYRRYCIFTMIKRLLRYEAGNSKNAKSIAELGIKKHYVKFAMSSGRISRIITSTNIKEYTYEEYSALIKDKKFKEEKIDFENDRFFIKEGSVDEANAIIEGSNPTVVSTILFCLLILASCMCIIFIMPGLLNLINSLIAK